MSDVGPEARGGASFQRENLSDLDDVLTTGDLHLNLLTYNAKTSKWGGSADMPIPVLAAGAGADATATVAAVANTVLTDQSGTVLVTAAGTPAANAVIFTVTFGQPLPANKIPNVVVVAANAAAATLATGPGISVVSNTGFSVFSHTVLVAATPYAYSYHVIY